jgi:hypothetical protein
VGWLGWRRNEETAYSFGWWLMTDADLFWEKSTVGWLSMAGLFWDKSSADWWLISQTNQRIRYFSHNKWALNYPPRNKAGPLLLESQGRQKNNCTWPARISSKQASKLKVCPSWSTRAP